MSFSVLRGRWIYSGCIVERSCIRTSELQCRDAEGWKYKIHRNTRNMTKSQSTNPNPNHNSINSSRPASCLSTLLSLTFRHHPIPKHSHRIRCAQWPIPSRRLDQARLMALHPLLHRCRARPSDYRQSKRPVRQRVGVDPRVLRPQE